MKIYVNRSVVNGAWGGGNHAVRAIYDHATQVGFDLTPNGFPDVILVMGLDADGPHISLEDALTVRDASSGRTKVVLRLNDNDARKGTSGLDERVIRASSKLDGTIFVSQWMHDTFTAKGWACKNNTVIINGCEVKPSIIKQPSNKIRIVSHHWSDNVRKSGYITGMIDDFVGQYQNDFSFTFIGRTKLPLHNTRLVGPIHGQELWNELVNNDVYVSESLWDPGPNHCSESICSHLPTYVHKDGGGCVEFAGLDHTYSDWEELRKLFLSGKFVPNTTSFYGWDVFATRCFNFIRSAYNA